MTTDINISIWFAASIGFLHTLAGPDHYLPFIVISRARKWSLAKTALITTLCGIGHVGSSVLIGLLGVALGIGLHKIEIIEGVRGDITAILIMLFGLGYFIYGLYKSRKGHSHSHSHDKKSYKSLTPWLLFVLFVFGPCEPLVFALIYPAAKMSIGGLIMVVLVFSVVTILTMLALVILATRGYKMLNLGWAEKYTHALAGIIIFMSGAAITFLGL